MQFSEATLKILKSFALINNSIHFKKGNRVVIIHPQKVIMGEAIIDESLPVDCAIFSLSSLLSLESVFSKPEFNFTDNQVNIIAGDRKVEVLYCAPECVFDGYEKSKHLTLPDNLAEFELSAVEFSYIKQLSLNMRLPHVVFSNKNNQLLLTLCDLKNNSLGKYETVLHHKYLTNESFTCPVLFNNLKVLEGDSYNVTLSSSIIKLESTEHQLNYWVMLQQIS